ACCPSDLTRVFSSAIWRSPARAPLARDSGQGCISLATIEFLDHASTNVDSYDRLLPTDARGDLRHGRRLLLRQGSPGAVGARGAPDVYSLSTRSRNRAVRS